MAIRLTDTELKEQYQEADEEALQFDPTDNLDNTLKFNGRFSQGWERKIYLREGIELEISQIRNRDRMILSQSATETDYIRCQFLLSGNVRSRLVLPLGETSWPWAAGKYWLNGIGSRGQLIQDFDMQPWSAIVFDIHKVVLRSFISSSEDEMPKSLQNLARSARKEIYRRIRDIQPKMSVVLGQILHCPYQGMVKRTYLESKVIELTALVLDHEVTTQQGEIKKGALKPEQIERIYYAKEILLRDMNNPPSLAKLSQQVGLNEFTLKQGFRQIFGTTVFGELRSHQLDIAKHLLAEQNISVSEIAAIVGYGSATALARAFRREFGISPKEYQKACR